MEILQLKRNLKEGLSSRFELVEEKISKLDSVLIGIQGRERKEN